MPDRPQVQTFFEDGYLFLPNFYKQPALDEVQEDVERMIDDLATRLCGPRHTRIYLSARSTCPPFSPLCLSLSLLLLAKTKTCFWR